MLLLELLPRLHRGTPAEVRREVSRMVPWLFSGVRGEFVAAPGEAPGLSLACAPDQVLHLSGPVLDDPQERRLAAIFAEQVRLAYAAALDREALRRESRQDPLTGLLNRRALEADAPRFGEQGYHLAVIDVDGLKEINDRQGHHAGDTRLRRLARIFQASAPFVYRLGGDEFVLLAPSSQVTFLDARFATLPCSVGWAEVGPDWRAAYRVADAGMYRVKLRRKHAASPQA